MPTNQDDSTPVGQVKSVVPPRMVEHGSKSGAVPPARLIEVCCCVCSWNGRCLSTEIDEACWGCGEWESLYEVDEDDEPDDIDD